MKTMVLNFIDGILQTVKVGDGPERKATKKPERLSAQQSMKKNGWIFISQEKGGNGVSETWKKIETPLDELELLLEKHDWTYQYSDASNTWKLGEAERAKIQRLIKQTGKDGIAAFEREYAKHDGAMAKTAYINSNDL